MDSVDSISKIVKRLRESRILSERKDYEKYSRDELIKLAQEGDQLATEYLINSHKDFLSMMSRKYIMAGNDGDDIEQIAAIAFWDAINSYNPKKNGDFEAYAGMIIKRKLTDELRKDNAEKRQINHTASSLDEPIAGDEDAGSLADKIPVSKYSAEEAYLGSEGAREILRFMKNTLSDAERDVIKRYISGYKVSEIAEETGMKYKSVENAIMRVKNKLADYMRNSYDESKKLTEAELEFSDEEKQVLTSVLSKIEDNKKINMLKEAYENYTEEQIDKEITSIEKAVEEFLDGVEKVHPEERYEYYEDIHDKIFALDDYMTDEQYKRTETVLSTLWKSIESDYTGPRRREDYDPYYRNGVRPSDFF